MTDKSNPVIECHECGLVQCQLPVPHGGPGKCGRCGAVLYRQVRNSIEVTLVLTLASLILFAMAVLFPMLTFKLDGREQSNNLINGSLELYYQGFWELAIVVFLSSVLIPGLRIVGMLYVLVPIYFGKTPSKLAPVFRMLERCMPWAMVEVYMLGIIVAIVKLSGMADIEIGIAVYAFSVLFILTAATTNTLDKRIVWNRLGPDTTVENYQQDRKDHYIGCHSCDLLVHVPDLKKSQSVSCPRCNSALHRRKTNSISRAWALLIAAIVFYIPANALPIMTVISFGEGEPDTIISGVIALMGAGMYPVALLVLFASIAVPVLKMLALAYVLISMQRKSHWRTRDRTLVYRVTEVIGRWSMLDIFMISILAALVKLDALATIEPGAGAIFFAAVVIVTMISAMMLDPRLIWDRAGENDD